MMKMRWSRWAESANDWVLVVLVLALVVGAAVGGDVALTTGTLESGKSVVAGESVANWSSVPVPFAAGRPATEFRLVTRLEIRQGDVVTTMTMTDVALTTASWSGEMGTNEQAMVELGVAESAVRAKWNQDRQAEAWRLALLYSQRRVEKIRRAWEGCVD